MKEFNDAFHNFLFYWNVYNSGLNYSWFSGDVLFQLQKSSDFNNNESLPSDGIIEFKAQQ